MIITRDRGGFHTWIKVGDSRVEKETNCQRRTASQMKRSQNFGQPSFWYARIYSGKHPKAKVALSAKCFSYIGYLLSRGQRLHRIAERILQFFSLAVSKSSGLKICSFRALCSYIRLLSFTISSLSIQTHTRTHIHNMSLRFKM